MPYEEPTRDHCLVFTIILTLTVTTIIFYAFSFAVFKPQHPSPASAEYSNHPIHPPLWSIRHPAHPVQVINRILGSEATEYQEIHPNELASAVGIAIISISLMYGFIFSLYKVYKRVKDSCLSGEIVMNDSSPSPDLLDDYEMYNLTDEESDENTSEDEVAV